MTTQQPHSPLGASSAYRWMACPGSVSLTTGLKDAESEYALEGTSAHSLAEACLNSGQDAWEMVSPIYPPDMADAVQVYLDAVRAAHPDRNQYNTFVERKFHCPDIHDYFYGTSDLVYIDGETLHVWDYKHGVGIVVEAENNPQPMYYGAGALVDLGLVGRVSKVVLHIAQPRGFHWRGPIREWEISTRDLMAWVDHTLVPAMRLALTSDKTVSGEHCRFCPARSRNCSALAADMRELEAMVDFLSNRPVEELDNAQVARYLDLLDTAKIVGKAVAEVAFGRLMHDQDIPGRKLVKGKASRVWKGGAEAAVKKALGAKAYEEPAFKSPAQIEKISSAAKTLVAQWAEGGDAGLTVAKSDDKRKPVNSGVKSLFTAVT